MSTDSTSDSSPALSRAPLPASLATSIADNSLSLANRAGQMESAFTQVINQGGPPLLREAGAGEARAVGGEANNEVDLEALQQQSHFSHASPLHWEALLLQRQYIEQSQRMKQKYEHTMLQLQEKMRQEEAERKRCIERQQLDQQQHQRIEELRQKPAHKESANASTEVKRVVRDMVIRKMQSRENLHAPRSQDEDESPATDAASQSYPHPAQVAVGAEDLFPLRQTLSEPNLKLRAHLHSKVRQSPITNRKRANFRRPMIAGQHAVLHNVDESPLASSPPSSSVPMITPHVEDKQPPHNIPAPAHLPADAAVAAELALQASVRILRQQSFGDPADAIIGSPSMPNISRSRTVSVGEEVPGGEHAESLAALAASLPYYPLSRAHLLATGAYPFLPLPENSLLLNTEDIRPQHPLVQQLAQTIPSGIPPGVSSRIKPFNRTRSAPIDTMRPDPDTDSPSSSLVKQQLRQNIISKHLANHNEGSGNKNPMDTSDVRTAGSQSSLSTRHSSSDAPMDLSTPTSFHKHGGAPKPFVRTQSSPVVFPRSLSPTRTKLSAAPIPYKHTTAVGFDEAMLLHACSCGDWRFHPENPDRLQQIMARFKKKNLLEGCESVRCVKATVEDLKLVHEKDYCLKFGASSVKGCADGENFTRLVCGGVGVDSDTFWNKEHTPDAVRTAAGVVIELASAVATGQLMNGFAVVRPPGHHAEAGQALGFCYFNNVAVAARVIQRKHNLCRILIVDWDVHHGNSTQQAFYDDPSVLYISIHRHDQGQFFPGTGGAHETGGRHGIGFNINIPFSGGASNPKSDAEYLAAFRSIVLPVAREFNPQLILVSAGFDAAVGHPATLGGYNVTPQCFAWMTRQLMNIGEGKVVLALEGGYEVSVLCDCSEACLRALKGEDLPDMTEIEMKRLPDKGAMQTLYDCLSIHESQWRSLERCRPLVSCSQVTAQQRDQEQDTVSRMASLSVVSQLAQRHGAPTNSSNSSPDTSQPQSKANEPKLEPMEEEEF